jgi:hypothetical protein
VWIASGPMGNEMRTILVALSVFCFAAFLLFSAINLIVFIGHVRKTSRASWVPIVGGVFGMAGCLLWPSGSLRGVCWIPLLADLGCVPGMTYTFVWHGLRWGRPPE